MVQHITPNSSIEVAWGDAFADSGRDFTLIVDANAFLISDSNGHGANLTGSWTRNRQW